MLGGRLCFFLEGSRYLKNGIWLGPVKIINASTSLLGK